VDKIRHTAKFKKERFEVKTNLFLILFQEDEHFIVYSPALDLSGYGYSEQEAKDSFNTVLAEFINYTTTKNTFFDELKKHGWKIKGARKYKNYRWT